MSSDLERYLDNPRVFDSVKDAIRSHDPNCESLRYLWIGRTGGVSCPSDLESCDQCGVMFFLEGTVYGYPDSTLCECCHREGER